MFLKKCIYVNWGNIPNNEFEFGPINLLSGGNGSGKTTAADAIQTIMTAAHDHLFTYNPGQDETTQRGRGGKQVRTLASYVLGCDDGSYARVNTTDGYIAACFSPTKGESATPFTAIVACRAHLERSGQKSSARQNSLVFFILPESELGLGDFQYEVEAGRHVVPLDKITLKLAKNHSIEKYETKKAYLKRLYAILRGKSHEVTEREALNGAKAFSRFMAYKPVKSINDFVANEILEKRDLGEAIRSVSDLLKTVHAMESDASRLKGAIDTLTKASSLGSQYINDWIDLNVWHYTQARHQYLTDQQAFLESKRQQQALLDEKQANTEEQSTLSARIEKLEDRRVELNAKRLGHQPLQQKDELEKTIKQQTQALHAAIPQVLEQKQHLDKALEATKSTVKQLKNKTFAAEIPTLSNRELIQSAENFVQLASSSQFDFASFVSNDWVDISPLESHLDQAIALQQAALQWQRLWHDKDSTSQESSLRDQISKALHRRESARNKLQQQIQLKQAEIDSLESLQVNYPYAVKMALEAIRRECPEAEACVLCDFVEVTDLQWQNAIEGYMGGARFSIIVDPEWEAEAIRIVRNLKGGNTARVIQGDKAKRDSDRIKLTDELYYQSDVFFPCNSPTFHFGKLWYGGKSR